MLRKFLPSHEKIMRQLTNSNEYKTEKYHRYNKKEAIRLLTYEELGFYFLRIGADEEAIKRFMAEPSLNSLCEIHRLQVTHIHVTNYAMQDIKKMRNQSPISPYFNDIFRKIVLEGHHGYCFENNQLLRYILVNLGYKVKFFNAHIIRDNIPKQDPQHVILEVEIKGIEYIVDAGYGGVAPIAVIKFKFNAKQSGAGRPWATTVESGNEYKLSLSSYKFDGVHEKNGFILSHQYPSSTELDKKWKALYIFQKKYCNVNEYKAANYRVSKNEKLTPFRTKLFETAFTNDIRISLTQDELVITKAGKIILSLPITSEQEYKECLVKYLGYSEQQMTKMDKIHERVEFAKRCK
ncbi:MAG: Arylamine N-acetyltransferase [Gammaproteobacteria bacterium]|jgi:arylamine N-acetyltransferase|nr:Arylamine N-acetyltransferase [Gammaproteobacteria bacterium]